MSQQTINLGTGVNTNTGDTVRVAFEKANSNFTELFAVIGPNLTGGWSSNTIQSVIQLGNTTTTGDTVRIGFSKLNSNFSNVFAAITANAVTGLANITLEGPQETINLGVGPNTNTGDTVRTAFAKVNDNFSILYQSIIGVSVNTVSQFGPTVSSVNRVVIPVAGPQITQPIPDYFNITADSFDAGIQLIDLGDGADTQTGDPIRVAFAKANHNFEELYQVFGSNGESNLIANTIIANNFSSTGNLRTGNIYSRYEITTVGNIVGSGFFYPNGVPITGAAVNFTDVSSNVIANSSIYTLGNVSKPWGSIYVNNGQINQDLAIGGNLTVGGNIVYQNVETGNLLVANSITTGGNVTAAYFIGDGRYLTGVTSYSNVNVAAYLPTYTGNLAAGQINDITGGSLNFASNNYVQLQYDPNGGYDRGNIANGSWAYLSNGGFYFQSNVSGNWKAVTLTDTGDVVADGNISGNYFIGNGSQLTGIVTYTNANVASYLPIYSGNVNAAYFIGNGSTLTSVTGANVTGTVANATYSIQAGQSNYANTATYVTGLTSTNVNVALGFRPLDSNATALTAQYVTANAQANITSVGNLTSLTVNGTTTSFGGIQNTVIGNTTAAAGYFTTLNSTGAASFQSLTVNASSTFNSNLTVVGNLVVSGNVITTGSNNTYFTDSILELHTLPNLANLTFDDGKDIGLRFHYYKTNNQNAFLGWDNTTGYLEWFSSNVDESASSNISGNYGTIRSGALLLVNTTPTTGSSTGALQVSGGISTGGNIYIAGNISANNFVGNSMTLGANTAGQLVSNAVTLTNTTSVTDAVAQLNYVLGKLVPTAPPAFPGGQSLTISTLSTYRMCNFTQTDNTTGANKSVAGGTSVSNVRRATTYTTSTIANVGPGDSGVVTAYRNGVAVGNVTLLAGNVSGTYGNLVITRSGDYANVSNITPGFWYSLSSSLSGNVAAGWNEVYIVHSGAGAGTNTPYWYYDASAPGTPTWSNTNIALTTNSVIYSSTIPHLTSSSQFTLTGNVAKLSGDMFPSGASSSAYAFVTGTAGGAIAAPASVTYAGANVTWPLTPNLYVSSGSAYLSTTAAVISGFGSSSTGPSLTADNSYATGATTFSPGVTVLYKTGTASAMEETSITFGSTVGTGSGLAARILNPGSTDTPAITGNTTFNSQTSTLQTYDATIVAGVLKNDTTNYSTGYLPVGPNLSGQAASQYFTFRFARTSVSKFDIRWSGTIAGLWVALPGSTIDTTSTLNGWLDLSVAYAGAGVPGAGSGGNGSNGAALGGVAPLNSLQTNKSITATFGTVSSSSTVSNEIFVRIKLTSGQTVTALSLQTASN